MEERAAAKWAVEDSNSNGMLTVGVRPQPCALC
jgi:hypothetical protein